MKKIFIGLIIILIVPLFLAGSGFCQKSRSYVSDENLYLRLGYDSINVRNIPTMSDTVAIIPFEAKHISEGGLEVTKLRCRIFYEWMTFDTLILDTNWDGTFVYSPQPGGVFFSLTGDLVTLDSNYTTYCYLVFTFNCSGKGDSLDIEIVDDSTETFVRHTLGAIYYAPRGSGNYTNGYINTNCSNCGDINGDNLIDIFDIVYLIMYLYLDGPPPDFPASADVNSDGELNIFDAIYIIAFLYLGGPAPDCP